MTDAKALKEYIDSVMRGETTLTDEQTVYFTKILAVQERLKEVAEKQDFLRTELSGLVETRLRLQGRNQAYGELVYEGREGAEAPEKPKLVVPDGPPDEKPEGQESA